MNGTIKELQNVISELRLKITEQLEDRRSNNRQLVQDVSQTKEAVFRIDKNIEKMSGTISTLENFKSETGVNLHYIKENQNLFSKFCEDHPLSQKELKNDISKDVTKTIKIWVMSTTIAILSAIALHFIYTFQTSTQRHIDNDKITKQYSEIIREKNKGKL